MTEKYVLTEGDHNTERATRQILFSFLKATDYVVGRVRLPQRAMIRLTVLILSGSVTVSATKGGVLDWLSSSPIGLYQNEDSTQSLNIVSNSETDVTTQDGTFAGHYELNGESLRVTVTILGTPQVFYYSKVKQGFESSDGTLFRSAGFFKKHASALLLFQKADQDNADNPGLAIDEYTQAIKLDPDYDDAYCSRGETESSTTGYQTKPTKIDYDAAIRDFTKAMEINPKNTRALNWRWKVKKLKGDLAGAIVDLKKYIQIMQNDSNYPFLNKDKGDLSILEEEKDSQGNGAESSTK